MQGQTRFTSSVSDTSFSLVFLISCGSVAFAFRSIVPILAKLTSSTFRMFRPKISDKEKHAQRVSFPASGAES